MILSRVAWSRPLQPVGLLGRFQSYRDGAMLFYAAIRFSKVRKKLYVI